MTPHLERLIDYVDDGGILDNHDDVPGGIRRDLTLESQVRRKLMCQQGTAISSDHYQCFASTKRQCVHDYFVHT
jgi:hypothetical protein